MPNECNIATEAFQTIFRMNANTATETVPNEIPNNCNMTTEQGHRTRLNTTTEKPTNILPKLSTEMATEMSTKNAPKLSSE